MFDTIDKLKHDYTDKYVVVDASRPELARFDGYTGQVKTVNMSGRALVQFDAWNNIGWYDIDLSCLKVVPKPEPEAEVKKAEGKAKEAGHKPAPKAAVNKKDDVIGEKPTGGAPGAKPGGKMSTADILAAARAKAGATPAATPKAAAAKPAAPKAAPAKPAAGGAAAPAPGQKLSTAEILAMARAKAGASAAPPQPVAEAATEEPVVQPEPAAHAPVESGSSTGRTHYSGPIPTTTAEKIALCRQIDTK